MDSSAYVKLVLLEPEHEQLRQELTKWEGAVSSALLEVEAVRACARYGASYARAARDGLTRISLLPLDDEVLQTAAHLAPAALRALDALHLATALTIAEEIGVVLVYDERLLDAVLRAGLPAARPGTARD